MRPIRLWTEPPQPDETWLSFLSRAAQSCGLTRTELAARLTESRIRGYRDWDTSILRADRERALRAAGIADEEAALLRPTRFVPKLSVGSRVAYCPRCAVGDLERRVPPYFRWQWALPTTTFCHVHGTPLLTWPPSAKSNILRWPSAWLRGATASEDFSPRDWLRRDLERQDCVSHEPGFHEAEGCC